MGDQIREDIKTGLRPKLPAGVTGRARERWLPLAGVAGMAGGDWPAAVDRLAAEDVAQVAIEKEDGLAQRKPAVILLRDIAETWILGETFVETTRLIERLVLHHREMWGEESTYAKKLTPQRLGRMLSRSFKIYSDRPDTHGPRGYRLAPMLPAMRALGIREPVPDTPPEKPDKPAEPAEPDDQLALIPGGPGRGE